jgi:hypothetical protein
MPINEEKVKSMSEVDWEKHHVSFGLRFPQTDDATSPYLPLTITEIKCLSRALSRVSLGTDDATGKQLYPVDCPPGGLQALVEWALAVERWYEAREAAVKQRQTQKLIDASDEAMGRYKR